MLITWNGNNIFCKCFNDHKIQRYTTECIHKPKLKVIVYGYLSIKSPPCFLHDIAMGMGNLLHQITSKVVPTYSYILK